MSNFGKKLAQKRKRLGITQIEFAEQLSVTRQTVSRWEAGTVMPDIDKLTDIAALLQVSCDYLLRDEVEQEETETDATASPQPSRLLLSLKGKTVRLNFFDDEEDMELLQKDCEILDFEGSWIRVLAKGKKGAVEKLVSLSSILSFEMQEDA